MFRSVSGSPTSSAPLLSILQASNACDLTFNKNVRVAREIKSTPVIYSPDFEAWLCSNLFRNGQNPFRAKLNQFEVNLYFIGIDRGCLFTPAWPSEKTKLH